MTKPITSLGSKLKKPTRLRVGLWGVGAAFFLFFTILSLLNARTMNEDGKRFAEESVTTTGVVIDRSHRGYLRGGVGEKSNAQVRFLLPNGKAVVFEDATALQDSIPVGTTVPVRYVPSDPEWAMIDNAAGQQSYMVYVIMFLVLAGAFFIAGLVLIRGLLRSLRARNSAIDEPPTLQEP